MQRGGHVAQRAAGLSRFAEAGRGRTEQCGKLRQAPVHVGADIGKVFFEFGPFSGRECRSVHESVLHGMKNLSSRKDGHAAARSHAFQHGPCRGKGTLFAVRVDEDAACLRTFRGGKQTVEGQRFTKSRPFAFNEIRAPLGETARRNVPRRPDAGAPCGERCGRLRGGADAVTTQRHHLEQSGGTGAGIVGGQREAWRTEKKTRQSGGENKSAAHDQLLFLFLKKYVMRRTVGQGFLVFITCRKRTEC